MVRYQATSSEKLRNFRRFKACKTDRFQYKGQGTSAPALGPRAVLNPRSSGDLLPGRVASVIQSASHKRGGGRAGKLSCKGAAARGRSAGRRKEAEVQADLGPGYFL